jgi:hypothetical protein
MLFERIDLNETPLTVPTDVGSEFGMESEVVTPYRVPRGKARSTVETPDGLLLVMTVHVFPELGPLLGLPSTDFTGHGGPDVGWAVVEDLREADGLLTNVTRLLVTVLVLKKILEQNLLVTNRTLFPESRKTEGSLVMSVPFRGSILFLRKQGQTKLG